MIIGQPAAPQHPPETSAAYLERVRENSNYHTLRSIIGVVFWVLVLALWCQCAFILFVAGSAPFISGVRGGSGGAAILSSVVIIAYGMIGTLLLVAGRQAAVLAIDIADTLQDAHRRK